MAMMAPLVTVALALLLAPAAVMAQPVETQQPGMPLPLYPGAAPPAITAQPLPPPPASAAEPDVSPPSAPAAAGAPAGASSSAPAIAAPPPASPGPLPEPSPEPSTENARVFCEQPVSVQLADPDGVPERYRKFIGIWSDASWTPSLCAALIVASVTPDGTASILYVFGPAGANPHAPGGVLRGTGVIRDGELRFQNSDGSQFAFRPLYADLKGHLTTPKGEAYEAIFKETP
jgi:hypothetical protein